MNIENLDENLEFLGQPYPGRMVLVGLDDSGLNWRLFSLIGGRSEGSRNRIYKIVNENGRENIETAVYDISKQKGDPSKTIYTVMTFVGSWDVASNGLQTKSIAERLQGGDTFENALSAWENEGPNADYTSRITAAVHLRDCALIGKITRNPLDFRNSICSVHELDMPPGYGFFITTYNGEGGTIPFTSDPMPIRLHGSLEGNMEMLWETFNPATRVALVGKEIDRGSGRFRYVLKNANLGD